MIPTSNIEWSAVARHRHFQSISNEGFLIQSKFRSPRPAQEHDSILQHFAHLHMQDIINGMFLQDHRQAMNDVLDCSHGFVPVMTLMLTLELCNAAPAQSVISDTTLLERMLKSSQEYDYYASDIVVVSRLSPIGVRSVISDFWYHLSTDFQSPMSTWDQPTPGGVPPSDQMDIPEAPRRTRLNRLGAECLSTKYKTYKVSNQRHTAINSRGPYYIGTMEPFDQTDVSRGVISRERPEFVFFFTKKDAFHARMQSRVEYEFDLSMMDPK